MLLLLAGSLKAIAHIADPFDPPALETASQVSWEWLLGLLLVLGLMPRFTWLAAVCTFAVFVAIAGQAWLSGDESCGCYGSFHVPPAITLAIDLALIIALLLSFPPAPRPARSKRRTAFALAFVGISTALIILLASGLLLPPPAITDPPDAIAMPVVQADPDVDHSVSSPSPSEELQPSYTLDLGFIKAGAEHTVTYTLVNPRREAVRIDRTYIECRCMETIDPPAALAAHSETKLKVRFKAFDKPARYHKRIVLTTNDDSVPSITLG